MEKEFKNVDDLFRDKFFGHEVKLQKNRWIEMNNKISKIKFWKFNYSYFNIYYASIIALAFAFSTYSLLKKDDAVLPNSDADNGIIEESGVNFKAEDGNKAEAKAEVEEELDGDKVERKVIGKKDEKEVEDKKIKKR